MSKQARWRRFNCIEALDFRHRLGYPADCHRIDPRAFERLRGEGSTDAGVSLRPSVVAPLCTGMPPSPLGRWSEAA